MFEGDLIGDADKKKILSFANMLEAYNDKTPCGQSNCPRLHILLGEMDSFMRELKLASTDEASSLIEAKLPRLMTKFSSLHTVRVPALDGCTSTAES